MTDLEISLFPNYRCQCREEKFFREKKLVVIREGMSSKRNIRLMTVEYVELMTTGIWSINDSGNGQLMIVESGQLMIVETVN